MFKDSRQEACQLIESILLYIPLLNLNQIPTLRQILVCIDDEGLSTVCKIFAVTLSNLDSNDKKYLCRRPTVNNTTPSSANSNSNLPRTSSNTSATTSSESAPTSNINEQIASKTVNYANLASIRDQNQEFLLNIPSFISRLVNLVRRRNYTFRSNNLECELENWIHSIDEALSDMEDNNNTNEMSFNSSQQQDEDIFTAAAANGGATLATIPNNMRIFSDNFNNQPSIAAAHRLNNYVYVLYTISLLLIGKEKKRVQKTLTKLKFASVLNGLFDHLIWNCSCEFPNNNNAQANIQQRTHICPEVAVKIQFLRLMHSFCDHSE
jgi:hypothetical protein